MTSANKEIAELLDFLKGPGTKIPLHTENPSKWQTALLGAIRSITPEHRALVPVAKRGAMEAALAKVKGLVGRYTSVNNAQIGEALDTICDALSEAQTRAREQQQHASEHFDFLEKIGEGQFGEVWRGFDTNLQRVVAIKLFKNTTDLTAAALNQARALARVTHRNVVRVYNVTTVKHPETSQTVPCIVMELIDGVPLSEFLKGTDIPNADRACAMGQAIIDGVAAIHRSGIPHGDLHSGNIIITTEDVGVIDIQRFYTKLRTGDRAYLINCDVGDARRLLAELAAFTGLSSAPLEALDRNATLDRVAAAWCTVGGRGPALKQSAIEASASVGIIAIREDEHRAVTKQLLALGPNIIGEGARISVVGNQWKIRLDRFHLGNEAALCDLAENIKNIPKQDRHVILLDADEGRIVTNLPEWHVNEGKIHLVVEVDKQLKRVDVENLQLTSVDPWGELHGNDAAIGHLQNCLSMVAGAMAMDPTSAWGCRLGDWLQAGCELPLETLLRIEILRLQYIAAHNDDDTAPLGFVARVRSVQPGSSASCPFPYSHKDDEQAKSTHCEIDVDFTNGYRWQGTVCIPLDSVRTIWKQQEDAQKAFLDDFRRRRTLRQRT